jgi:hypothetical protein
LITITDRNHESLANCCFILNCVQKVADPSEGEDEKGSGDNQSLATALTTPPPK